MLKIAICDDQEMERFVIDNFLKEYFATKSYEYTVVQYSRGENLVADYEDNEGGYNLLFLDILMDGMSGIEVARRIREYDVNVKIVFTTASADYILAGYDVFAFNYLIKPLEINKLKNVCDRFLKIERDIEKQSLSIRANRREVNILFNDIVYIESSNTTIYVHTKDEVYRTYGKLGDFETQLTNENFLRCHQSYIINLNFVKECKDEFVMEGGQIVPMRQKERKQIRSKFVEYTGRPVTK